MNNNRISTTQLAEICGVSQGTVDRALNNRKGISGETKEKILAAAREYGYRPNIHARSMAGGHSMLIGIVVFDLRNQYFSDILTELEACCQSKGYSTVVMFTDKNPEREMECIRNLYHMSVDGIVICPVGSGEAYENFLLSLHIPVVTIGNKLEQIPYIGINNTLAMQDTIEYVLSKGYEKLIYVKPHLGQQNTFAQTERLNAFCGLCQKTDTEFSVASLSNAELHIDPPKKNAFICPTDIYAIRLLHLAKQHCAGIIGFDNIRIIDELDLRLDSVAYDIKNTAKVICNYIIKEEPVNIIIEHLLVKRGSI